MTFDINNIINLLSTKGLDVGVKVLVALAFWFIGRWLINKVTTLIKYALERNKVDPTLNKYLGSITGALLNIVLVIGILGYFGIETASFAALLAGAGLAIGTAWGGLLTNFAAGAFLLVLRPFKVGDAVTIGGVSGTVKELGIFGTSIITGDNVLTIVGNNKIFSGDILNFSKLPARRVDRTALIPSNVDPMVAIEKFRAEIKTIKHVDSDPAPEIFILEFTASGTLLAIRPFAHNDHYGQVYADTNAMIARVKSEAKWTETAPLQLVKQV